MSTDKVLYEQRIKNLETELQKATNTLTEYKKNYEEFILIASHDLQAPLRKVSTFIEKLIGEFQDAQMQEAKPYIDRIQASLTNMRSMVDSLSELSAVTETKPDFQKCDLNQIAQNIIEETQPSTSENQTTITYSPLPIIEGNCTQLKHLFQNLINNSIKFRKKDTSLQINIDSKQIHEEEKIAFNLSSGKTFYKIELTDNGIGFEDKYAEKIFDPFHRLHGKSEYDGSGLGLAICKKIMEKHNGIIYAKGSKISGARFILILPQTVD